MKKKKNNNLVAIKYADGKILYFTSYNRAGVTVGLSAASVKWACHHGSVLIDNNDKEITFEIVDGSEIQYKNINN